MITRSQQLKQAIVASAKLRSWLGRIDGSTKEIKFLQEMEKNLLEIIKEEAA